MSKKKHKKQQLEQSIIEEEIARETDVYNENSHSQVPWQIFIGGILTGMFILALIFFGTINQHTRRGSILFTSDSSYDLGNKVSDYLEDANYIDKIVDIDYEFRTVIKHNDYSQEYSCLIVYEY